MERERETLSRLAVLEERARIAREIHDVVARSLSVIVLQSDGARDNAIKAVHQGDAVVAPSTTRRLLDRFLGGVPATKDADKLDRLTAREREVLILVSRGLSNAELAAQLHLSEATIKTHVSRILDKLELRDRVQAVVLAYQTGLAGQAS